MNKKTTVYIACPYTIGDQALNVKDSMHCFNELVNNGFVPFNPLLFHFQQFAYPRTWESWMEIDLSWLEKCDCILRLPGKSRGADKEIKYAKKLNKIVFYSIENLRLYYLRKDEVNFGT